MFAGGVVRDEWDVLLALAGPEEDFDLELLWILPVREDADRNTGV